MGRLQLYKGQTYNIIGKQFKLESYGKVIDVEGAKVIESPILKKIFKENELFFLKGESKKLDNNISVNVFYCSNEYEAIYNKYSDDKAKNKYIFIIKDNILIDTLKVKKDILHSMMDLQQQMVCHMLDISKQEL